MSLQIIFRPARNFNDELNAWLDEYEKTATLLRALNSAMDSLQSLEADREVMNMTLQLMATDFSTIAAKVKGNTGIDDEILDIRNLLHRTSDIVDGFVTIGIKVKEATEKIRTTGNTLTARLIAKCPKQ